MEIKQQSFKDKQFQVVRGSLHPDYSFHTFELEEHDFREQYWNIQEGEVVIDVGASYGSYSLTACAMGAKVYAFEPEPLVFQDLVQNIAINHWQDRCFPNKMGLWNEATTVDMKSYAPHWPAYTISTNYPMTTLDQFISNRYDIERLDWLKIDVEGAEELVILGGLRTISHSKPKLIIECHNFLDAKLSEKVKTAILSVANYEFKEVDRPPHLILCGKEKQ